MTVATNRPDGWRQATRVGYVNDGLTLYFLCAPQSQKAQNLGRDDRVSLTIDHDASDPMAITGLSMAAHAQPVDDPTEITKALSMRRDARCRWGHVRQEPMVRGLSAGGEWIRNFSSAMARHPQQRGRLHFGG